MSELANGIVDPLDRRIWALGIERTSVACRREGVQVHLDSMMRYYGLSSSCTRADAVLEMLVAETRCTVCKEAGRCRRFLTGAEPGDVPGAFCPNADLFAELLFGELHDKAGPGTSTC